MTPRTALVSNASNDHGLAAIRALARAGFEVYGCDVRRLPMGMHSRFVKAAYVLDGSSEEALEADFLTLVRRLRPHLLLPISSRFVSATCRNSEEIHSVTAVNVPDNDAFLAAYRKDICMDECRRLGIPCPASYGLDEAIEILTRRGGETTLVVKPHFDVGAATDVSYVCDVESLRENVQACKDRYGGVLIQDYVLGGMDSMRTVVLLFSRGGKLAAAFTTRKLRHWPPTGGTTAVSLSTGESHLVDQVLPFFRKWRWRGAAEVELKFDARDESYKVIEINPRFPAYLRFAILCGLDLPVLAARLSVHSDTAPPDELPAYRVGATYLCPGLFLRSVFDEIRTGGAWGRTGYEAVRYLSRSARGILEMLADPLPLIGRALVD